MFKPFWAHSREAEKQAFLDFLAYVEKRRQEYPDMHVYHYAAYEKTALRKLSVMHVAGEDTVDQWLRDGLLVDLYQTVRNSIRISENSYSIKKLEPLYMGQNLRSGDVKDAGASVVAYAHYCDARDNERAAEADTDPRRDLGLQRVRLPLHAGAPELAAGAGAGPRHRCPAAKAAAAGWTLPQAPALRPAPTTQTREPRLP